MSVDGVESIQIIYLNIPQWVQLIMKQSNFHTYASDMTYVREQDHQQEDWIFLYS